jgi:hypothetical protein
MCAVHLVPALQSVNLNRPDDTVRYTNPKIVMHGLDPCIWLRAARDCRVKPGNDEE